MSSSLHRVNRNTPCPICAKDHWCYFLPDGTAVVCMRRAEGSVKELESGGFVHRLRDRTRVDTSHSGAQAAPVRIELATDVDDALLNAIEELDHNAAETGDALALHAADLHASKQTLDRLKASVRPEHPHVLSFVLYGSTKGGDSTGTCSPIGAGHRAQTGREWLSPGGHDRPGLIGAATLDLSALPFVIVAPGFGVTARMIELGLPAVGLLAGWQDCPEARDLLRSYSSDRTLVFLGDLEDDDLRSLAARFKTAKVAGAEVSSRIIDLSERTFRHEARGEVITQLEQLGVKA